MATHDVPGYNPVNRDVLAMGCWAEHEDGSLILVEGTEGGRVVYSIFDVAKSPPLEYRDAIPEDSFKKTYTWRPESQNGTINEKWTWHDKTPFPWDRVIKSGFPDGSRLPSADHIISAAERVAQSLKLRGVQVSRDLSHRQDIVVKKAGVIWDKIQRAVSELRR